VFPPLLALARASPPRPSLQPFGGRARPSSAHGRPVDSPPSPESPGARSFRSEWSSALSTSPKIREAAVRSTHSFPYCSETGGGIQIQKEDGKLYEALAFGHGQSMDFKILVMSHGSLDTTNNPSLNKIKHVCPNRHWEGYCTISTKVPRGS
jgi:hypothetical protein